VHVGGSQPTFLQVLQRTWAGVDLQGVHSRRL
jgi:hypothetical protein